MGIARSTSDGAVSGGGGGLHALFGGDESLAASAWGSAASVQAVLEHQGVLAGITIVPAPESSHPKPVRPVKALGLEIGGANLQGQARHAAALGLLEEIGQERPRDAATPLLGRHGEIAQMAAAEPHPGHTVSRERSGALRHPRVDLALRELTEEERLRPRVAE